jgi:predicted phage tail protein
MKPRFLPLPILAVAALWSCPVRADGGGVATPDAPAASAPVTPAAPASSAATPPPVARKEDDPSFLARILSYGRSRDSMTNAIHSTERQLADLRATVADRDATIETLRAENAQHRADLERIAAYLTSTDRASASADPAAAFAAAVSTEVSATVRQLGIPAAVVQQTPAAATSSKAEKLDAIRAEIAATTDPAKRGELADQARKLRYSN